MLISDGYREQQESLHAKGNYGVTAHKYGPMVSDIVDKLEIDHLLDYGCGSNKSLTDTLAPKRNFVYQAYDPCVPDYAGDPDPADMVVCVDVLEHIEPLLLDSVLDHITELAESIVFLSINTGPAGKVLDDGRNAHLIQQPMTFWLPKLWERFDMQKAQVVGPQEFIFIGLAQDLEIQLGPQPVGNGVIITE